MKEKATGWKIPLVFCAAIMAIVLLGSFFKTSRPDRPELPEQLVKNARQINISLSSPQESEWKERIISASSGFLDKAGKDQKLAAIIAQALSGRQLKAACAAVVHVTDADKREHLLADILDESLKDCSLLPMGVFAVHGSRNSANMQNMAARLWCKWRDCQP